MLLHVAQHCGSSLSSPPLNKTEAEHPHVLFSSRPIPSEGLALPLPSLSALHFKARLQHSPPAWLPTSCLRGHSWFSLKALETVAYVYKPGGLALKSGSFASLEKLEDLETFGPSSHVGTTDLGRVTAPASSRALPTASPGCPPQRTGVPWAEAAGQGAGALQCSRLCSPSCALSCGKDTPASETQLPEGPRFLKATVMSYGLEVALSCHLASSGHLY